MFGRKLVPVSLVSLINYENWTKCYSVAKNAGHWFQVISVGMWIHRLIIPVFSSFEASSEINPLILKQLVSFPCHISTVVSLYHLLYQKIPFYAFKDLTSFNAFEAIRFPWTFNVISHKISMKTWRTLEPCNVWRKVTWDRRSLYYRNKTFSTMCKILRYTLGKYVSKI